MNSLPTTLKLSPADLRWATWRPYTPRPRPQPQPFVVEKAIEKIAKSRSSYWISWNTMHLPHIMSREEADLWLTAMVGTEGSYNSSRDQIVQELRAHWSPREWTVESLLDLFSSQQRVRVAAELVIPLWSLTTPADFYHVLTRFRNSPYSNPAQKYELVSGLHDYIMPYLTDAERAQLRDAIRPDMQDAPPLAARLTVDLPFYFAAAVGGFSDVLEARLATLPNGACHDSRRYNNWNTNHLELTFGLDDPEKVERQARRLQQYLQVPDHVSAWLAHTGTGALDWICESIMGAPKDVAEPLAKAFTRMVEDVAAVPAMLKLQKEGPAAVPAIATAWLTEHPDLAVTGAAAVFATGGAEAFLARDFLRACKRKGETERLNAVVLEGSAVERYKTEILDYTDNRLPPLPPDQTPAWLSDGVAAIRKDKKSKPPAWVDADELPQLSLNKYALTREHISALLFALSKSTLEKPHPFVTAVKAAIDPTLCDQFAWKLFERWVDLGAESKEKWALIALGLLGGDASVFGLTPLIRKWPGESQHQRAKIGLSVLRAIGTDTALMQINNLSQKLQFKALKAAAQDAMNAIAEERGMTADQLADRIVPDCGLDADGRRTFDYGPRQFTLVMNAELKPMIRGEDGKLKPDLPKPNSSDDAEKASIAQAEWKLIKKQVRDVAKVQSLRLETAMMSRRTWTSDEFRTLLVDHPLMIHLVRSLVWGGFDEHRKLKRSFRVTDEKDYANQDDDPVTLEGIARVGLVHPLQLSPAEIAAWGQILSDYDRLPPFSQLGRKTYQLNPDEVNATEITRYKDVKVQAVVLVGVLQKLGWLRGAPGDGGVYYEHAKPFPADNVTAIVQYQGLPIGYLEGWDDQSIERCFFIPGVYRADHSYPSHKDRIPLGKIDPVIMSEVLRDLALISHKGGN